jgi:hypothetical protein
MPETPATSTLPTGAFAHRPPNKTRRGLVRAAGLLIAVLLCSAGAADRAAAFGLTVTPAPLSIVEGETFNGTVATIIDTEAGSGEGDLASHYAATIVWGDGVTSTGTVTNSGGVIAVSAPGIGHTYAEEGTYTITVEVSDSDFSSGQASSTVTVADAPLSAAPMAAPSIFNGAGATPTSKALSAFEAGIGGANDNAAVGEQTSGFRTVNWDEVKLDGSDFGGATTTIDANHVVAIPDDRFASRGIDLRAPIAVANDGFLSVNPGVSGRFPAFSAANIVAPFSSNTLALNIVAPAGPGSTPVPAATRGLGAVFLNVRLPNTTSIEYLSGDTVLARDFAPVGGAGLPSFAGALFASPVVTSVVINLGTAQIFGFDGTTFTAGLASDDGVNDNLVAMDDLALAEPAPEAPALTGTVGTPMSGTLASFSDSDPNGNARDLTANVDWGDDSHGGAQVTTTASGGFAVVGGHTYSTPGTFAVTITAQDLGGAKRTFHTTATIAAPPASAALAVPPKSPPSPPSPPSCTLTLPSAALSRARSAAVLARKRGKSIPKPSRLRVIARCNQTATALITATASLKPSAKRDSRVKHTSTISLGQARADLSANVSTTLTLKLTATSLAKLRSAVARHERVSVRLTLAATNGNGAASASANVASLKLR